MHYTKTSAVLIVSFYDTCRITISDHKSAFADHSGYSSVVDNLLLTAFFCFNNRLHATDQIIDTVNFAQS